MRYDEITRSARIDSLKREYEICKLRASNATAAGKHDSANAYLDLACNKSDLIYCLETGEDIDE